MIDRKLKAVFTFLLGVLALLYVTQNLVNLEQAYGAFAYVTSLTDHTAYPQNLLPALAPAASNILAWVIFAGEGATGLLLLFGSFRLWSARHAGKTEFEAAKTVAKLGCAAAILVWFGLFTVFGGGGYQMWQTEIGSGSLMDAFTFWAFGLGLLIYLNQAEPD